MEHPAEHPPLDSKKATTNSNAAAILALTQEKNIRADERRALQDTHAKDPNAANERNLEELDQLIAALEAQLKALKGGEDRGSKVLLSASTIKPGDGKHTKKAESKEHADPRPRDSKDSKEDPPVISIPGATFTKDFPDSPEGKHTPPPSPSSPNGTYFISLSPVNDQKLTVEEKFRIKLVSVNNLAKILNIATNPQPESPQRYIRDLLTEIANRLHPNLLVDPASRNDLRTQKIKSYGELHQKLVERIGKITEADDLALLIYTIIDIEDFFLTLVRVTEVAHALPDFELPDDAPPEARAKTILHFLKDHQDVAGAYITIFGIGGLAYGADQMNKKRAKDFNANAERVFSELIKLYEANKKREQELGLPTLSLDDWRQEMNRALEGILEDEKRLPERKNEKDEVEEYLSDYYDRVELTWIASSQKDAPEEPLLKWALKLTPKQKNLGIQPDKPKTTWEKFWNNFLEFMDMSNNFLTITSLWFWVAWMNIAVAHGDRGEAQSEEPFVKFVVQFIWAITFGLGYVGRLGYNYTFRYLNKKTPECDFNGFNNIVFRNITSDLSDTFPGCKTFFEKNWRAALVLDTLGYIFYKAPLQALAFPSVLLSTLFAATEKAVEENSKLREIFLFLSFFPMLAMVIIYLPFRGMKYLFDLCFSLEWQERKSKSIEAFFKEHYLLNFIFIYPFKIVWHLVNLPVKAGVSLFSGIWPEAGIFLGFKKKKNVSFNDLSNDDLEKLEDEQINAFENKEEHLAREKRNLLINTHAISLEKRLMLIEKGRSQRAIVDAELAREKSQLLSSMPKEVSNSNDDDNDDVEPEYTPTGKYEFQALWKKHYPTKWYERGMNVFSTTFFSWWGVSATLLFVGWMIYEFAFAIVAPSEITISAFFMTFAAWAGAVFAVLAIVHAGYRGYQQYNKLKGEMKKTQYYENLYNTQRTNHEALERSEFNIAFYLAEIQKYIDKLKKHGCPIDPKKEEELLRQNVYPHSLVKEADFFDDVRNDERRPHVKNQYDRLKRIVAGVCFTIVSMIVLPALLLSGFAGYWAYTGILFAYVFAASAMLLYLNYKKDPNYDYYKSAFVWSVIAGMGVQSGILFVRLFLLVNAPEALWLPLYVLGIGTPGAIGGVGLLIGLFVGIGLAWTALKMYRYEQNLQAAKFMDMINNLPERNKALETEVELSQAHERKLKQRYKELDKICNGLPEPKGGLSFVNDALSKTEVREGHMVYPELLRRGETGGNAADCKADGVALEKRGDGYVRLKRPNSLAKSNEIYINNHSAIGGKFEIYYPRNPKDPNTLYDRIPYRADYFPEREGVFDQNSVVLQIASEKYAFYRRGFELFVEPRVEVDQTAAFPRRPSSVAIQPEFGLKHRRSTHHRDESVHHGEDHPLLSSAIPVS